MKIGFVKYNRTDASKNLHTRPIENHVLNVIASRVSRKGNPVKGVQIGESIASDFDNFGLKRQPLRTALANLRKWGYLTTRATNKTTYAKLVNIEVYDCNIIEANQQDNQQLTTKATSDQPPTQPTANHYQEVKKKEEKKERSKDIVNVIDVCAFFESETGKKLIMKKTDALIKSSDKYKVVNARIQEGATVEDCKTVIRFKNRKWKNDQKMSEFIRLSTLFARKNFTNYLEEAINAPKANSKTNASGATFSFNTKVTNGS
jgi:uncharacterized phage protein (TIGR02220 family)